MLLGSARIRQVRMRTLLSIVYLSMAFVTIATAQESPPPATTASPSASPVIPSLESPGSPQPNAAPKALQDFTLPKNAGQQWVEYDIRPFTKNVKGMDKPQQWLVDWIIRETGSDAWFHEPFGVLSGDKDTLRVYHTPEMQRKVAAIYEKFVNGTSEPQIFGLRIITISNPN